MIGPTIVEASALEPHEALEPLEALEALEAHLPLLKALADPTRLRVVALLGDGARCACALQDAVEVPANLLSHHLKVLREAGLIEGTRRGRWIDYRLVPARLADAERLLGDLRRGGAGGPPHACAPDRPRPAPPIAAAGGR